MSDDDTKDNDPKIRKLKLKDRDVEVRVIKNNSVNTTYITEGLRELVSESEELDSFCFAGVRRDGTISWGYRGRSEQDGMSVMDTMKLIGTLMVLAQDLSKTVSDLGMED